MTTEGLLRETKLEVYQYSSPTLRVAVRRLGTLVPMTGWTVEYFQKAARSISLPDAWLVEGSVNGTGTAEITIPGSLTGTAGRQRYLVSVTPPGEERKVVLAGELVIIDV